ncbi:MAG: ribonuclease VapC37 [Acidimicrobiales bacterium]|nr:MAG: ribonuclease VapC37 [Acidimicrobiales bacterium]
MLVDANVLLYSVDVTSRHHEKANEWLTAALNGDRRVEIPWMSIWAFVRIATSPRASRNPLTSEEAWEHVEGWLEARAAWVPEPGPSHEDILGDLLRRLDLRGRLVADAVLAAVAIEHGLAVVSADSDFARFPEVTWINPLL